MSYITCLLVTIINSSAHTIHSLSFDILILVQYWLCVHRWKEQQGGAPLSLLLMLKGRMIIIILLLKLLYNILLKIMTIQCCTCLLSQLIKENIITYCTVLESSSRCRLDCFLIFATNIVQYHLHSPLYKKFEKRKELTSAERGVRILYQQILVFVITVLAILQ